MIERLKQSARLLKRDTYALYFAYRDPRTPWYAKAWAMCVTAYAFSPVDLIPDFIPILGYLDDLVIVPVGVLLALRLIPPQVMDDSRQRAEAELAQKKPISWSFAVVVVIIWGLLLWLAVRAVLGWWNN